MVCVCAVVVAYGLTRTHIHIYTMYKSPEAVKIPLNYHQLCITKQLICILYRCQVSVLINCQPSKTRHKTVEANTLTHTPNCLSRTQSTTNSIDFEIVMTEFYARSSSLPLAVSFRLIHSFSFFLLLSPPAQFHF